MSDAVAAYLSLGMPIYCLFVVDLFNCPNKKATLNTIANFIGGKGNYWIAMARLTWWTTSRVAAWPYYFYKVYKETDPVHTDRERDQPTGAP